MLSIRKNIFETNSSSCHSLTICSLEDYNGWGTKTVLDRENEEFISWERAKAIIYDIMVEEYEHWRKEKPLTFEEFEKKYGNDLTQAALDCEIGYDLCPSEDLWYNMFCEYEVFEKHFCSPLGEEMVAIGYYGFDG